MEHIFKRRLFNPNGKGRSLLYIVHPLWSSATFQRIKEHCRNIIKTGSKQKERLKEKEGREGKFKKGGVGQFPIIIIIVITVKVASSLYM